MRAADIRSSLAASRPGLVADLALRLMRVDSPNPPGATEAVAATAAAILAEYVPEADVQTIESVAGTVNLVARLHGAGAGRRIVFNGHLDTYPVGPREGWSVDPSGELRGDRLYGRGGSDMKGGIAASIVAFAALAAIRAHWRGEVVLTLAGDEESMGPAGTQWLLDTLPWTAGDAVLIGDAGSPRVLRFGEKGFLWVEIEARGRAAHGAHVHLGDNALDRLRTALDRLVALTELRPDAPAAVTAAIAASRSISEPLAGAGEADVLGRLTVNLGLVEGGTSPNLVPAIATAAVDIRIPVGLTIESVEAALGAALDLPGVGYRVLRRFAPNHTDPEHRLVRLCAAAAREVTGEPVAVNMRVGGSDARWFRMRDIPTLIYGPTPHGMGGPDEFVLVTELDQVARVHALTAYDFLQDVAVRDGP